MKDLADFPIGVAVGGPESQATNVVASSARQAVMTEHFSQITAENAMKMSYLSADGTTFTFGNADQLVDLALANGLSVHGHALVWHPSYQLPSWATSVGDDFKEKFETHITTVASHYAGQIESWDVVNEALWDNSDDQPYPIADDGTGLRQSTFYSAYASDSSDPVPGYTYIAEAFRLARAADPNAELYYNDFNIEENDTPYNDDDIPKTTNLVNLLQYLLDENVPIDGVGFQMHVLIDYPSIDNITASLQKAVDLRGPDGKKLKVKVTELDVRINNTYAADPIIYDQYNAEAAERQKARYKEVIEAYLDTVPADQRGGITVWGIADSDSWFATHDNVSDWPLLFDDTLQPKAAYEGVAEALGSN